MKFKIPSPTTGENLAEVAVLAKMNDTSPVAAVISM